MKWETLFSFEIFFIILRESLEIIIIVSILLALVKQSLVLHHGRENETLDSTQIDALEGLGVDSTDDLSDELNDTGDKLYRQFRLQIWSGSLLGLLVSLLIGGIFIAMFYIIGTDLWSLSEHYYEGSLSILASVVISIMGLFFLRLSKLKEKFRVKLANLLMNANSQRDLTQSRCKFLMEKYSLFFLPFITCLRESLEAFVFIGGVGISQPLTTLPLSSLCAICVASVAGYYLYRSSNSMSLKIFLITMTGLLYLLAAGLFSKGVWQFELQHFVNLCHGQDMSEVGSGPGSYDIVNSVWHVNCCNGEIDGGWMLLTAIFGWTNSATYFSVISYNLYWISVICVIKGLQFQEIHGYFPLVPLKLQKKKLLKRYTLMKNCELLHDRTNYIPQHLLSSSTPLLP
jgi:high-affinity iron transporter